ncbi:MAG: carbohydrate binding domain-containing protein [Curtobacterium sp.]
MSTTIMSDQPIHTVTHAWTGTAGASTSIQYQDGVGLRINLALNPTFTTNTNSWSTTSNVTLTRDTTVSHSSGASGKIVSTVPTQGSVVRAIQLTTPAVEDTDYIVSFWVYVPADLSVPYRMRLSANVGGMVDSTDTIQYATNGWQQVSIRYRTPVGATTLYFNPMLTYDQGTATDTFYVDDVMIETGVDVRPYFDGGTDPYGIYGTSTPLLVDGWEESAETRNVVNNIVGGGIDITPYPAGLRSGQYTAVFQDEDDAADLVRMHQQPARFTIQDDDRPSIGMLYVANGTITRALDDESREFWEVTIPFQEVDA